MMSLNVKQAVKLAPQAASRQLTESPLFAIVNGTNQILAPQ